MQNSNYKALLAVNILYSIGNFVAITLVNLFLWEKTDNFSNILIYNLFVFSAMCIGGLLGGIANTKIASKRIFQFSTIFYVFQICFLVFFQNNVQNYLYLIGIFSGLANVCFYYSISTITQLAVKSNRESFFGKRNAFSCLSGFSASLILSFLAQKTGSFDFAFITGIVVFVLIFVLISRIEIDEQISKSFSYSDFFKVVKENPDVKKFFQARFIYGLQDGLFWITASIILLNFVGGMTVWGILNGALTLVSAVGSYVIGKTIKSSSIRLATGVVSMLFAFAALVLAINWNLETFLFYQIILVFFYIIVNISYDSFQTFITNENASTQKHRGQINSMGEVTLNLGRIFIVVIFIMFGISIKDPFYLKIAYIIAAVIPIQILTFMNKTKLSSQV